VLAGRRLDRELLLKAGGPFDIGALVELGETQHRPSPPETEDYLFSREGASLVRDLGARQFWNLLSRNAEQDLRSIFGNALRAHGASAVVDLNEGRASLGCLSLKVAPRIEINPWGRLRAHLTDGRFNLDLSVTDLRLYHDDYRTPRRKLVDEIVRRTEAGVEVILAVGLTRPFRKEGDTKSYHWLQVNNVHLEDDPIWKLA
jgi:hypothetical protein